MALSGWGGRRPGAGRGKLRRLDPDELRRWAHTSRARAAQFLGTSWEVVDREARRLGIPFAQVRHYGVSLRRRPPQPSTMVEAEHASSPDE